MMNSLCSLHSHGFHKTNTAVNPFSTISGATPLIVYSFKSANYTSINGTSGYYTNLANPGTDSFYVYNSVTSGSTTSTFVFNYIYFSTNSGTTYIGSTNPKGSIGNNNTTYSNVISSISASTSFTAFTMTYWILVNGGGYALWNRWGGTPFTHDYQIYALKSSVENAGNGLGGASGLSSTNGTTWFFYACILNGTSVSVWNCAVGSTFPSTANAGPTSYQAGNAQGVNANCYFVFGSPQWPDGNAIFYLSDLRMYGSALSQSDLNGMFTAGPNTN